ncbi:MAG: DUF3426 domain-containing protein, partial [Pseudomonadota bacterium]|nr:DUF3426 domain-containing protein [Pseudomonadota bacterium]
VRCGACKEIFNGIEHLLRPAQPPVPLASGTATDATTPTTTSAEPPDQVTPAAPHDHASAMGTAQRPAPAAPTPTTAFDEPAARSDIAAPQSDSLDVPDRLATASGTSIAPSNAPEPSSTLTPASDEQREDETAAQSEFEDQNQGPAEGLPQPDDDVHAFSAMRDIPHEEIHQADGNASADPTAAPAAERFDDSADLYPAFDLIASPATNTTHAQETVDDPLQRMTLMQVTDDLPDDAHGHAVAATHPEAGTFAGVDNLDTSLAGHLHAASAAESVSVASPAFASTAPPDELDQAIARLQRKPWRGSKKAAIREEFESASEFESDAEEPSFVTRARRRARDGGRAGGWRGALIGLLLLGAVLQAGYAFRDQIAAHVPALKPGLVRVCSALGCHIDLPAQADAISIDSNDLTVLNAAKNSFTLTLLLRNRSTVAQRWPSIELTLLDANERPIIRRVFAAAEYLPPSGAQSEGFPATSEQSARINFELRQQKAANYRVVAFYP